MMIFIFENSYLSAINTNKIFLYINFKTRNIGFNFMLGLANSYSSRLINNIITFATVFCMRYKFKVD